LTEDTILEGMKRFVQEYSGPYKYMNEQIPEPIATKQSVRQWCGLLTTLFNVCINEVVKEWKGDMSATECVQLNNESTVKQFLVLMTKYWQLTQEINYSL
jgi:hypothetical protein